MPLPTTLAPRSAKKIARTALETLSLSMGACLEHRGGCLDARTGAVDRQHLRADRGAPCVRYVLQHPRPRAGRYSTSLSARTVNFDTQKRTLFTRLEKGVHTR